MSEANLPFFITWRLNLQVDVLDLLAGQDPELKATARRTNAEHIRPVSALLSQNRMNWLIITAPVDGWAEKVFPIENGEGMSDAEFAALGGNNSLVHVDFMIGSGEMDVDGVMDRGAVEPVMRAGEWAFEV